MKPIWVGAAALVCLTACRGDARSDADADTMASDGGTVEIADANTPIVTGRSCSAVDDAAKEIDQQAHATIPLVTGLTFGYIWVGPERGINDFDIECLTQVTQVEDSRIVLLSSCSSTKTQTWARARTQLCRADLRTGTIYRTETGPMIPDLVAGSTMSMMSRRSFRELRDTGNTPYRQVHLRANIWQESAAAADSDATIYIAEDAVGTLRRTRLSTMAVQLNDSLVELPVIEAETDLNDEERGFKPDHKRVVVLNDERFPIVLDNHRRNNNARIRFVKITWPEKNAIEEDLEREKTARVYGLYFDTNSDSLRPESEQVLNEIGTMLREHAEWRLRIEGHTDSLGGAAFNQDLSLRRAKSVRATLAAKYGIDPARLDVSGAGDTRPVDANDTETGRARNRRVELVRL